MEKTMCHHCGEMNSSPIEKLTGKLWEKYFMPLSIEDAGELACALFQRAKNRRPDDEKKAGATGA